MQSSITFPRLPLDGLLRRAAERDPDGCALRTAEGALTFAELDSLTDRFAACVAHLTGRPGARIGVANTLGPEFPAAYYGAVRGGGTAVLVNPLIKEAGLLHVFSAAAVEVAFVPPATAALLGALRERLPALRAVVVVGPEGDGLPGGLSTAPFPVADLDADACVQFTTGTTGRPRGVRLSHRNLVANAAQTAAAHRLDGASVTLNHLPLFHTMHLNSAVFAGATQVLCTSPDPLASLALAARTGATHYYGLPARLHRLAGQLAQAGPGAEGCPPGPR
ncbi:AMP-binding protein [Streptomyces nojiriensis]